MRNQKSERVGQIRRRSEFCGGTKLFVRNAQVEGLFAECTMSEHNEPFDTLTYFIQSRAGGGKGGKVFLPCRGQAPLSQFGIKYGRWRFQAGTHNKHSEVGQMEDRGTDPTSVATLPEAEPDRGDPAFRWEASR